MIMRKKTKVSRRRPIDPKIISAMADLIRAAFPYVFLFTQLWPSNGHYPQTRLNSPIEWMAGIAGQAVEPDSGGVSQPFRTLLS